MMNTLGLQTAIKHVAYYTQAERSYSTSSQVSTEMDDRSLCGYTISVFNEATQPNSAWSSLRG